MTTRARLLVTVSLLPLLAFACEKQQAGPPGTTAEASAAPGVAATPAPAEASSLTTTTSPSRQAGVAALPGSPAATLQAPASATTASLEPATLATPPPAPPTPAAATPASSPATPPQPAAERPKGKLTLPAKLGAVTFDHEAHAGKQAIACETCHHPSRPQKPQAVDNQPCRDCHTQPPAAPMKTSLQAAFHDPRGGSGTCIDCHKKHVAASKVGSAPVKCLECHKRK